MVWLVRKCKAFDHSEVLHPRDSGNHCGCFLILLLVVLSGRFIQFLEKAANGELSVQLMLTMILWRVPSSLELILPLALTLSVLLVMGRMNQESELTILRAAG